ncbi:HAMP domain-containing sensor histidine kinase [Halorubrum sp. AJ67]|uniref:sensor histidine kinase n=1 Tax=Halorubrum sp. AJ67 TaxID=1173487 RepID=UPI00064E1FDC|nr:GAF domain-containing sensor histidine kinase [Halorubrum sp. AJ67]
MGRTNNGDIRYEQVVSKLHDVASELAKRDSREEICQQIIDSAETLLDFDLSVVALEEDGQLHPKFVSSGLEPDEFDAMSIDEGIAGKTYRTGESYLIEDITEWEEANPQGSWISAISLPIGEFGNFQAVSKEADAFNEQDLQLAELLITHASHHLDRVANKEELEQQNDRLEEFASVVSHDLRNPLSVATGRLELAKDECDSEHLDGIARAHDRMERLIDDLLTLARTGNRVSNIEPVDLATLTANCWENVSTSEATLNTEINRQIQADQSRLKQLLENLMRNAVEHGGDNVTITVGEVDGGFYVEDNGPGIPDEEQEVVFEMGYSTTEGGTGFGLNIVKQIAQAHGWDIHVIDGSTGGARFEITGVEFAAE